MNLTKSTDMATVVHAMSQPDSGLEVRDRMWLKITIPQAFIGLYIQSLLSCILFQKLRAEIFITV